ncbi:MAG: Uma2 family endonuclease [Scytonematopsis contorta HA4267-MV1]|jgi:Uma2 family endonuclease|nr:Uma2 family endonuclease [Scytonematopsis contorta HA4267-MV1]
MLEIEYSKPKVDKLKLYASMGIPEFWRYNGSVLRVYTLSGGQYTGVETSPTFAQVAVKEIPQFILQAKKDGESAATRAFRNWVRQRKEVK